MSNLPDITKYIGLKTFYTSAAALLTNKIVTESQRIGRTIERRQAMSLAWSVIHQEPDIKILTFVKKDGTESRRVVSAWVHNYYTPKGTGVPTPTFKFVDMALLGIYGVASDKNIRSCRKEQVVSLECPPTLTQEQLREELGSLGYVD